MEDGDDFAKRVAQYLQFRADQQAAMAELDGQVKEQKRKSQQQVEETYARVFLSASLSRDEVRSIPHYQLEDGAVVRCEGKFWALSSHADLEESNTVIRCQPRPGCFFALDGANR